MTRATLLPRCTPAQAGLDPQHILDMIQAYQDGGHALHSFLLVRHGQVLCEGYYAPYSPEQLQTVFSLSKTFTSLAVGIAADEEYLSLDDRVIDLFPQELADSGVTPGPELSSLTLRHLLRMSTGQAKEPERDRAWQDMRIAFLQEPFVDMPGETFRYNTMATYMLSAALKKKGIDLEDYLQEKLLTPMGVTGTRWLRDGHDICTGGFGFSLMPELIAKLGVCILNDGQWEGQQLIPRSYIAMATRPQIYQPLEHLGQGDWNAGYGYQMWMCVNGCFRGDGMYGQFCLMDRRTDTVLALTGITADTGEEMRIYYEHILNAYQPHPLPENPTVMAALQLRLAALQDCHALPEDDGSPVPAALLRSYTQPFTMALSLAEEDVQITLGQATLRAGRSRFLTQQTLFPRDTLTFRQPTPSPVQAAFGMKNGVLTLRLFDVEGMNESTITLTPTQQGISVIAQNTTNPQDPYTFCEALEI